MKEILRMELGQRVSVRLQNYDYSGEGIIFITICCQDRKHRFGKVRNEFMCLNSLGSIAFNVWMNLIKRFEGLELDTFQVMPNHIHGILIMTHRNTTSLSKIIGAYKSEVFMKCLHLYKSHNKQMGKLWQRNYYEHIIRDHSDLVNCQAYIKNNPINWTNDHLYS